MSPQSGASCGLELRGEGPFIVFATRSGHLGGETFAELTDGQYAASLVRRDDAGDPGLEADLEALASLPADPGLTKDPLPGVAGMEPASSSRVVPAGAGAGAVVVLTARRCCCVAGSSPVGDGRAVNGEAGARRPGLRPTHAEPVARGRAGVGRGHGEDDRGTFGTVGWLLRGAAAGAAGTTALNVVTYLDMAVRGRARQLHSGADGGEAGPDRRTCRSPARARSGRTGCRRSARSPGSLPASASGPSWGWPAPRASARARRSGRH